MALWDIDLGATNVSGLGSKIAHARLAGRRTGPWPAGPLPAALETWRAAGGVIEIERFALDWQGVGLLASGTVALDERLQPTASLVELMTVALPTAATPARCAPAVHSVAVSTTAALIPEHGRASAASRSS